ncbi:UNKNOWN [Stylonychia lemnae]|uniref:DUSP domain-containing protein n=1 Tax=Stylonychia lemnae TaxID=5949 RepID=A0A078AX61_STYLE|nr:UNKNOWN [Stylonychia lemnae]|eukprot:CDW87035.1 UNKNOWN [Stylonychia lemnae]
MMPLNSSHQNNNDESIHTFIRENQSLLQVIPSGYSTKGREQHLQQIQENSGLIQQDDVQYQQQHHGRVKQKTGIRVKGTNNQQQERNPYNDSLIAGTNNNGAQKSRSQSLVSIIMKDSSKSQQSLISQNYDQIYQKQPMQQNVIGFDPSENQMALYLIKLNTELRDELRLFKQHTDEKINDLEMKHINQQETIQYLLNLLQKNGLNVFNKIDLKDDSIQDSMQIRNKQLNKILRNLNPKNKQSELEETDEQEEKNETENLYYYSQEEMYKHNETSNYDQDRLRNISEPDIVQRVPFDLSQTIQSQISQLQGTIKEDSSQQYSQTQNLKIDGADHHVDGGSASDNQYFDAKNETEREVIQKQIDQNLINTRDQNNSKQMLIIDLQNQSYPANKQQQQHFNTFNLANYVSGNSNNISQYLKENQSKLMEQQHNLIQNIEERHTFSQADQSIQQEFQDSGSKGHIQKSINSKKSMTSSKQTGNFMEDGSFMNQMQIQKQSIEIQKKKNNHSADFISQDSLGSSPTQRNRNQLSNQSDDQEANEQATGVQDPKLIYYVKDNNEYQVVDDDSQIFSPNTNEEVDNYQSINSHQGAQSNFYDQATLKYHDHSHNFDSGIDKTTLQGYTENNIGNFSTKNLASIQTHNSIQNKQIFQYMQSNSNMNLAVDSIANKKAFQSADKSKARMNKKDLEERNQQIIKSLFNNQNVFTTQIVSKSNQRSRSQMGFSNLKRSGIHATHDVFDDKNQFFSGVRVGDQKPFDIVSIKKLESKLKRQTFTKDSFQQQQIDSIGSIKSQSFCNCSISKSKLNINNVSNNNISGSVNGQNYCCSTALQRSVEFIYSQELRRLQDMNVIMRILNKYQQQYHLTDFFNKNLNTTIQKEIIQELSQQFMVNQRQYENLYVINSNWWRDWCKYTNYNDNIFLNDSQKVYQTGVVPKSKIPIKNFNDLVKGKRPESIKNMQIKKIQSNINFSDLLTQNFQDILDDGFIIVSIDIWTFLKTWYEADYKIKVRLQPGIQYYYANQSHMSRGQSQNELRQTNNDILLSDESRSNLNFQAKSEQTLFKVNQDDVLSTPNHQKDNNRAQLQRASTVKERNLLEDRMRLKMNSQSNNPYLKTDKYSAKKL